MDAPKPLTPETKGNEKLSNFNMIEELDIKQNDKNYKIQLGINEYDNPNEMIIKVISSISKGFFYFQNKYNQSDFQSFSKIFSLYENIKEIISFLKTLKFEIYEKEEELIAKFDIFLPNGKNQKIELKLKKVKLQSKSIINYLTEENKMLKEEISKEIKNNKNEILLLKEENKLLWNRINELQETLFEIQKNNPKLNEKLTFDSKIINSMNEIKFILEYIKKNKDKSFSFNYLHLLYRASKDGDNTKILHQLCDNKEHILIIIISDTNYNFGGYSKIGFKVNDIKNLQYKEDNNSFLFSKNLKKVYPAIQNLKVICHIQDTCGFCFTNSLGFFNNFFNNEQSFVCQKENDYFKGFSKDYEMNGGKRNFKIKDLEVFQLK